MKLHSSLPTLKEYNVGFDILKLALSVVVVCLHVNWRLIPQGYLAVEIFFVLAGFLFVKSGNIKRGVFNNYKSIIKKTYFKYAISLVLFFAAQLPLAYSNFDYFVSFSMLQGTALKEGLINPPVWFLCVLIWIMPLFSLIKNVSSRNKKILLALVSVASFISLYSSSPSGSLNGVFEFGVYDITAGQLRCMGGISLGMLLAYSNYSLRGTVGHIALMSSLTLAMLIMLVSSPAPYTDYAILILAVLIVVSIDGFTLVKSLEKLSLKKTLPEITLSVFLFHYPYVLLINKLFDNNSDLRTVVFSIAMASCTGLVINALASAVKKRGSTPLFSLPFRKSC